MNNPPRLTLDALPFKNPLGCLGGGALAALLAVIAILFLPLWVWYGWRIEPGNGEIATLIRKTGSDLPPGQVIAENPGQKGIQIEVLSEGRYFRNPYDWGWDYHPITDIPAGQLGVLVRLYGKDPAPGAIIAAEGEKGVLPDVLRPGKYRVNPAAFEIREFDAISIHPGCVGVVTSLAGKDVLTGEVPEAERNEFLVGAQSKGVQAAVLDPGTYYLNPYIFSIVEVNLQSQRFEMSNSDAISFLTSDGFNVVVEGTIEFNIIREKAALLTHRVGDSEDILKKIILPRARGFSRIEGSKKPAVEIIAGLTRQDFQNNLEKHLKETCEPWGLSVNSVLIRNIKPPEEIASVVRDRELAVQEGLRIDQQIIQAQSKAELTRQESLATQNTARVTAETTRLRATIEANQTATVKVIDANRELDVAQIELKAAEAKAEAITLKAKAEGDVIRMRNEAEAGVLAEQAGAFGGGDALARFQLYQKLAPRVRSILTDDQSEGLGTLLQGKTPATQR